MRIVAISAGLTFYENQVTLTVDFVISTMEKTGYMKVARPFDIL